MQSLVMSNNLSQYSTKEAGPIILAIAFVIAMGGAGAAAIAVCGWGRVKSYGFNWSHKSFSVICK